MAQSELFTPRSFIAGRLSARRGEDAQLVTEAAGGVLGTEHLAVIYTRLLGDVWYLAAPATDLASHPDAASTLAAALPGAPGHEGDGAYTADLSTGLQAVVVKQGDKLHCFVGSPAMVLRFAALEGATATHACAGKGMVWQLPEAASLRRKARLQTSVTASGLLVAVLSAAVWLWAALDVSHQDALGQALQKEHLKAWASAVAALQPSVYPKALADLQKAVTQAGQENGALVEFDYRAGRATWTLNANGKVVSGASN
jgi:hypothetical protein